MKKNNLISIIVPIYNVEKYLKKCIDSIINQTYKNLEIILVDDGSPDNCGKICDEYAKKDNRIKVIHKENGGVSSARNVGVENATGEVKADNADRPKLTLTINPPSDGYMEGVYTGYIIMRLFSVQ